MNQNNNINRSLYPLAWNQSYASKGTQWRGGFDLTGYAEFLDLKGNVLELGSGDGNTAAVLLPRCGNLVCADIAISSFRTLAMKNTRLKCVAADARQLPFAEGNFSAVFSRHVLTHAIPGDDALMLAEITRVLAPGGTVLIEVFAPGDMRFGKGQEIFPRTFLRDDGLVWRFFLGRRVPTRKMSAAAVVATTRVVAKWMLNARNFSRQGIMYRLR